MRKELQGPEEFERAAREEVRISSDFGLPLCALSLRLPEGEGAGLLRPLLEEIRVADLATSVAPDELDVVLPNTGPEDARRVEERLRAVAPGAATGLAAYEPGESPETLIGRARESRQR